MEPADYESKDSYTFDVKVSDGELSDTQTVTVDVIDIEEYEGPLVIDLISSGYDTASEIKIKVNWSKL